MKGKSLTHKGKYILKAVDQPLKPVQGIKDKNCNINYIHNKQLCHTHKDVKYDTKT